MITTNASFGIDASATHHHKPAPERTLVRVSVYHSNLAALSNNHERFDTLYGFGGMHYNGISPAGK